MTSLLIMSLNFETSMN